MCILYSDDLASLPLLVAKPKRKVASIFVKPEREVNTTFLHCSASDLAAHDDVSVIKRWHVVENGWSDVGYHFFIKRDGTIQFGRSLEHNPAAQKGHNTGSIAICLHGNARFTKAQFKSLKKLCNDINNEYSGMVFRGHNEVNKGKACPVYDPKIVLGLDKKGRMAVT